MTRVLEVEEHDHIDFRLETIKDGKLELTIRTSPDFRNTIKNNTRDEDYRTVRFNGQEYLFYPMFYNPEVNDLFAEITNGDYPVIMDQTSKGISTNGQINIAHLFMLNPRDEDETTFTFNTIYSKESVETYAKVLRQSIEVILEAFMQPIVVECSMTYYTMKG